MSSPVELARSGKTCQSDSLPPHLIPPSGPEKIRTSDLVLISEPNVSSNTLRNKPLTNAALRACIPDCTPDAKTSNEDAQGGGSERDFAEAIALIAKLPLSDAEKAEAVRRLLAGKWTAEDTSTQTDQQP